MDAEAFQYSLVAGDAALHRFAAGEAATHYEVAHRLITTGQVPQVEIDKVRHLYVNLGRTLELLRRLPTTWARRLAFGRDPQTMGLRGIRLGDRSHHPGVLGKKRLDATGKT